MKIISCDGKEFSSEKECRRYELWLSKNDRKKKLREINDMFEDIIKLVDEYCDDFNVDKTNVEFYVKRDDNMVINGFGVTDSELKKAEASEEPLLISSNTEYNNDEDNKNEVLQTILDVMRANFNV